MKQEERRMTPNKALAMVYTWLDDYPQINDMFDQPSDVDYLKQRITIDATQQPWHIALDLRDRHPALYKLFNQENAQALSNYLEICSKAVFHTQFYLESK